MRDTTVDRMAGLATALALALLTLGALVWASESGQIQGQIRERIQQKKVVPGQSARDVRTLIGEPKRILRTQTYWETFEDWVYGEGEDVILLTFERGRLTRITDSTRSERK
jgi:hypothetical protein